LAFGDGRSAFAISRPVARSSASRCCSNHRPELAAIDRDAIAFQRANLLGGAIERQQVEDALRVSEAQAQKAVALQEMLKREISHRVKNSLAMVTGLLNMQRRATTDPALRQALDAACTRVTTIEQLHDRLWRADEVQAVNLMEFMGEVCDQVRASGIPGQTLSWDVAPVKLATDQAVPLALIVTELVTNAFKHAHNGREGNVHLTIQPAESGRLRLTVRDDGDGLSKGIATSNTNSLGMKLIAGLS
jgi:two-component sensor histidine kinase